MALGHVTEHRWTARGHVLVTRSPLARPVWLPPRPNWASSGSQLTAGGSQPAHCGAAAAGPVMGLCSPGRSPERQYCRRRCAWLASETPHTAVIGRCCSPAKVLCIAAAAALARPCLRRNWDRPWRECERGSSYGRRWTDLEYVCCDRMLLRAARTPTSLDASLGFYRASLSPCGIQ